jgi:hypothetical protein
MSTKIHATIANSAIPKRTRHGNRYFFIYVSACSLVFDIALLNSGSCNTCTSHQVLTGHVVQLNKLTV